jgi:hypothetical protein
VCESLRRINSRKLYFGFVFTILLFSNLGFFNLNLFTINSTHLNQDNEIDIKENANSIVFNGMYYSWSGSITIIGLGSFGWSGTETYTYQSGRLFLISSTNTYFGAGTRTVDNASRLLALVSGSSAWTGHDPFWIFNNVTLGSTLLIAIPMSSEQTFTVNGEANRSALGKTYLCWYLTGSSGSVAYYEKITGLLIYGDFRFPYSIYTYSFSIGVSATNALNFFPCTLNNGQVIPPSGNTSTYFTFSANYTDPDNVQPAWVHLHLDNSVYNMIKQNSGDTNYADGCIYQYITPLTNATHQFHFEAYDYKYSARDPSSSNYTGPYPVNQFNIASPTLSNGLVSPNRGHNSTIFTFEVTYTDADNNPPSAINLILNQSVHSMVKKNPADINYMDGCIFVYSTKLNPGVYNFCFNASDGQFACNSTLYLGPTVWIPHPATPMIFNGMYYFWSGTRNSLSWNGNENYSNPTGNVFQNNGWYYYYSRYTDAKNVNNLTRFYPSSTYWGSNSRDWVWIWNNLSLYDTTRIAVYRDGDHVFNITGTGIVNRLGKDWTCWKLTDTQGSVAYYDQNSGLLISGTFYCNYYGWTYTIGVTSTNAPDYSPPVLSAGKVTPTVGNLTNLYNFTLLYTDEHMPLNGPYLTLNGASYKMTKVNAADTNYTDGALYQYATYLPNGTYAFHFNATEGRYWTRYPTSGEIAGPTVQYTNIFNPTLTNRYLSANWSSTLSSYIFRITYTDLDNNAPLSVNLILNGITYPLAKQTTTDNYYVDGCVFQRTLTLNEGNYFYYFNTSDLERSTRLPSVGAFSGPFVFYRILNDVPQVYSLNSTNDIDQYYFRYSQTNWAAVAMRPPVGADFDLDLYSTYNLTQLSASSSISGANIDLVALNRYDITSSQYRFSRVLKTFGQGNYRIEMQNSSETLTVLNSYQRTITSSELINIYQLTGHQINRFYQINVTPSSGLDVGVYVFNRTGGLSLALNSSSNGELGASESVIVKLSSLNAFGLIITNENGANGSYSIAITDNIYPPVLSDTTLNPGSGNMTIPYTFTVKYTDRDNYAPTYMRIILNGTAFQMNKQNSTDSNYIDGCIYNFTTVLSGNVTYYYEANDGRFRIRYPSSSPITGPLVRYGNLAPPALNNGVVIPTKGWDLTVFTFQVNYSDSDNNPPSSITVSINGTSHIMSKRNQLDINWMDGVIYEYIIMLGEYGNYYYHFNASDGVHPTSYPLAGEIQGPTVTTEMHDYMMYFPVQYQWVDATTGYDLYMSQNSAILGWDLPFLFPFYNQTYTEVNIGANGYLSFAGYNPSTWMTVPSSYYQRYILPYLESFYPVATGEAMDIYLTTKSNPNRLIVEWVNMRINAIGGTISSTFEVILYETGAIKFQYDFVSALDGYQVVGLNYGDGIHYNLYPGLNTSINDFAIMLYYNATQRVYENVLPAVLSDPELTPSQGNTTTPFTFRINYTDPENYKPASINVVINGISYPMAKQNPADRYYVDGCIYEYTTIIPTNFTYYFTCNDQYFNTRYPSSTNLTGPPLMLVSEYIPMFFNAEVLPYHGFEPTLFEFYVNYTDLDNNPPTYVSLTINGTTHQMEPVNPSDIDFIDGAIYFYNGTMPLGLGTYVYYFNTSDGFDTVGSPLYVGPEVQPYNETILVNEVTLAYERVELLNLGPDQDMTGWSLVLWRENTLYWTASFPAGLIFHKNDFIVFWNGGYVNETYLGFGTNLVWWNGESGAVAIVNNLGEVVDFMCWNDFSADTPPGTLWFGSGINIPVLSNMYRHSLTDTHTRNDWSTTVPETFSWQNWNPGQIPPINYAPTLSSPAVNPLSGPFYTEFTFEITYTDANNNPPSSILVYINGTGHPLTKRYADFVYTDGCIYEFKTTLDPGTYNYYFTASDGALPARSPSAGSFAGPNVVPNYSPILSNPLLTPGTGTPSTVFTFSINYTDSNNDHPSMMNLTINGVGTFTMTKQNSGDLEYRDGCIYVYSISLDEGHYAHYFTASDGYVSVRLPISDSFDGPTVNPPPNQPPSLTGGTVLPPIGAPSAIFIFKVTYKDAENTPPTSIYVVIDSIPHAMVKANPSDANFIDGVDYLFATSLSNSSHTFYFTTSDGLNSTQYPAMGTINGPIIQIGGGGGGVSFSDMLIALIIAAALAVTIPIIMYTMGRRRRRSAPKLPQKQGPKAIKEEIIAPKDQRAHVKAEPTLAVMPESKPFVSSGQASLPPPAIPEIPVKNPLTEGELRTILQSISFLSEEMRKDLLERMKPMTYEQQQDIIKAFKV